MLGSFLQLTWQALSKQAPCCRCRCRCRCHALHWNRLPLLCRQWANSLPQGSHTGMSINMLRTVGGLLDYVSVLWVGRWAGGRPVGLCDVVAGEHVLGGWVDVWVGGVDM